MYRRILVPLDGSAVAEAALEHAVRMAEIFGAELILLRAAFTPPLPGIDLSEAQQAVVVESEAYLEEVIKRLQPLEVPLRTVVCQDQAAEAIVDHARRYDVSVVVMATHGHTGLERWPLGSVAEKVLRSMQVPTLLIRAAPDAA